MTNKTIILDRVKKYFSLDTNKDLADFLGVSKQTISNWYNRNTLDYEIVISKCTQIDFRIDLKWLLCGKNGDIDWDISIFQKRDQDTYDKQLDDDEIEDYYFNRNSSDRIKTIDLILKKANYLEKAALTTELVDYIFNIVTYIRMNSIDYNLDKLYTSLKKDEITMDGIEALFDKLIDNDTRLYEIISPYKRELKAINALMDLDDMEQ
ncbi:helix-turn-helix domain-containing protein [uncultured Muribaculum sp.]|uniref:helix-turn-helix domain-containing protein n=1 Tax=uncultured Muribaculum sp. TaxID=1918613 RepID=UPI00272F713A|nr:helix-turn-helix domain-containing protein [uncultured Muribaculum sp.]